VTTIQGVHIQLPDGALRDAAIAGNAAISHTKLAQRVLQREPVSLTSCRTWDSLAVNLPATPASDDLGVFTGTPGTDAPRLTTGDLKATTTTRRAAFEMKVPDNYDDGQTFNIQVMAGMQTTISDGTATVDLQAFKLDGGGGISADLYTGAAQSINSLAADDYVFQLTGGLLDPGDNLQCVLSITIADAATATEVIGNVYGIYRMCDTRG
jgi:hypothetical protein